MASIKKVIASNLKGKKGQAQAEQDSFASEADKTKGKISSIVGQLRSSRAETESNLKFLDAAPVSNNSEKRIQPFERQAAPPPAFNGEAEEAIHIQLTQLLSQLDEELKILLKGGEDTGRQAANLETEITRTELSMQILENGGTQGDLESLNDTQSPIGKEASLSSRASTFVQVYEDIGLEGLEDFWTERNEVHQGFAEQLALNPNAFEGREIEAAQFALFSDILGQQEVNADLGLQEGTDISANRAEMNKTQDAMQLLINGASMDEVNTLMQPLDEALNSNDSESNSQLVSNNVRLEVSQSQLERAPKGSELADLHKREIAKFGRIDTFLSKEIERDGKISDKLDKKPNLFSGRPEEEIMFKQLMESIGEQRNNIVELIDGNKDFEDPIKDLNRSYAQVTVLLNGGSAEDAKSAGEAEGSRVERDNGVLNNRMTRHRLAKHERKQARLNRRISRYQGKIARLQGKMDAGKGKKARIESKIARYESKISDLQAQLS